MTHITYTLLFGFLLIAQGVHAQQTIVAWEYTADAPEHFLLSIVATSGETTDITVAPSAPGACNTITIPGTTPRHFVPISHSV